VGVRKIGVGCECELSDDGGRALASATQDIGTCNLTPSWRAVSHAPVVTIEKVEVASGQLASVRAPLKAVAWQRDRLCRAFLRRRTARTGLHYCWLHDLKNRHWGRTPEDLAYENAGYS